MTAPTRKQVEALAAIRDHIAAHGWPPSVRELGEKLGVTVAGAKYHLDSLTSLGLLAERPRGASRCLRITEAGARALATPVPPKPAMRWPAKPFPPLWQKRHEEQQREALPPSRKTMETAFTEAAKRRKAPAEDRLLARVLRAATPSRPVDHRAEAIREMYLAHPTWLRSSIAREFGVSVEVVNCALAKLRVR